MHESNYQQLYHTFYDFCSSQDSKVPPFSKTDSSHIFWILYQSETYHITKSKFLTACLHIVLVLRWSGTSDQVISNISGFLITGPVLIFTDLERSILYSLSTILYIAKQESKQKLPWVGWKWRQYFLYISTIFKSYFWSLQICWCYE